MEAIRIISCMINEKTEFEYTKLVQGYLSELDISYLKQLNLGKHASEAMKENRRNYAMEIIKLLRNKKDLDINLIVEKSNHIDKIDDELSKAKLRKSLGPGGSKNLSASLRKSRIDKKGLRKSRLESQS